MGGIIPIKELLSECLKIPETTALKMAYDPSTHHRRSIRLKGYDYSQAGMYFITICCAENACIFGKITARGTSPAQMELNEFGKIAYNELLKLPERFPNLELDVFQIMPNHLHAILALNVRAGFTPAPLPANITAPLSANILAPQSTNNPEFINGNEKGAGVNNIRQSGNEKRAGVNPAPTIGEMVGAYKSRVANECLKIFKPKNQTMGKLWHRNYYEHIIRTEQAYQNISNYIVSNPEKWLEDKFYVKSSPAT